ncbi:PREDICTED: protein ENDOSPERM DEFECTIVE 1-like [Populus euphratica]|uniref:Protein ENDOSPERM DEFECTIVE 1-like n=1 Tax=Populus euphratica TaxID=75702 RepID=A0AAJ6Y2K5_POPEU|nr:PREDICTED: protein ENDOSPERM DEFECTIVE 1-like [Populus euphratica]XP_011040080.1 PREDICTED: protein ENDOSPERM DEFECTIVE 1-like [Populus euphratica]
MDEESITIMQEKTAIVPNPPPRRPRVREVSSRFMSPIASSSSSLSPLPSNKQRSNSVQRQRRNQEADADCSPQRKHHHQRAVIKLFKENEPRSQSHRPDTPTVSIINTSSSSKLRLMQQRSTSNINISSAAAKLLQSTGISNSTDSSSSSSTDHDNINPNTKNNNNDVRSSLPDLLRDTDARFLAERNLNRLNNNNNPCASPCSRSLNLQRSISSCDPSLFHSLKSTKLPPVAPCSKIPNDASRKTRKVSSLQEDVQSLKLLHNHYLQWRYVNAKAQASAQAQRRETERNLYSLGVKITELYESVKRKRAELGLLQRLKILWTIVEAQMPYLDEWAAFEMDYSISLSEAIQALLNASLQVPISGNVKVDIREVGEALNSATKLMDTVALNIESLMPKAEETEHLISELARVTGGEKALIEECGDLLSMTYNSQVEECSLQGQLIQFYRSRHNQHQDEQQ